MGGDDEPVRNGGAGSKERRELCVVSRSSFRHPRRRRTLCRRAHGTEHRRQCVWGVGSVNLDRLNAERVKRLTLGRNGVMAWRTAHRGLGGH